MALHMYCMDLLLYFICVCVLPELDPNNYMTFYRRATVYLAMGKSKSAMPDLDVVLSLKPDFNSVCCVFHRYAYLLI